MNIVSLPIELDTSKIDSRFRLVIVAAQRARQLIEGAKSTIPVWTGLKETTIAVEEILSGEMEILYGEEAVIAQQEQKRLREEMKRRAILAEREGEISNEIKKDLSIYLGEASTEHASAEAPAEASPTAEKEE
ncbi:MAG: DNA-directed RNA polymerase subunit omega [Nitrospiria bacterium]